MKSSITEVSASDTTSDACANWLAHLLQEVLALPTLPAVDVTPAALGLTSLGAVTLQYRLMRDHNVSLTVETLLSQHSICALHHMARIGDTA